MTHLAAVVVQVDLAITAAPGDSNVVPLAVSRCNARPVVVVRPLVFKD